MTDERTCRCMGQFAMHKPALHADRDGSESRAQLEREHERALAAYVPEDKADEVERLRAELAMFKRGGRTLGEMIEWQCRAVLDATGLHHLIGEDGDGDWALVWEHLAELLPRAERAEAKVARVRSLIAHLHTDLAYVGDIHAALADPEEDK